jgi:hypothetical protein
MKTAATLILAVPAALALAASSTAAAGKSCEALKSEITAKLDARKVSGYTLAIVDAGNVGDAKVVGTCDAGARKITYVRK